MEKQPTHSDLMKEIEKLKKQVSELKPKDELAPYRDLLDQIRKAMPQKEYVPYPVYPSPYNPWYPGTPWITYTSGTTGITVDTLGNHTT